MVDSKDMSPAIWSTLVERVRAHLALAEVRGVVITHGTDTLEETAYLLHRVVDAGYVRAVRYFAVATLFLTMTSPKASYSPDSLARQTHGKLH
jgi:hypothetical protein